jgi:putative transposase
MPLLEKMVNYIPEKYHRRSLRLPGYDYSREGVYFITIGTWQKECLFGIIADGQMTMNQRGQLVQEEWIRTAAIRGEIELDVFQVMPNHFHALVFIVGAHRDAPKNVGADSRLPVYAKHDRAHSRVPLQRAPRSLGSLVAGFKSAVTRRINESRGYPGQPVWQRNYYEHVIRNEDSLNRIREYIVNNPLRWHLDRENSQRTGEDDFDR